MNPPSSDAELESLESSAAESIRNQSLNLAKHIACNEVLTKELIRLEMEPTIAAINVVQQQKLVICRVQLPRLKTPSIMIDQGAKQIELEHLNKNKVHYSRIKPP